MKQYLLSIYQPDGPPPPPEVLEPVMRNLEKLQNRRKAVIYLSSGYDFNPFETSRLEEQARRMHLGGTDDSGNTTSGVDQLLTDPFYRTQQSSQLLAEADLVVSCTGAPGRPLTTAMVQQARRPGRPLVLVDLAVPRDIDPEAATIPGVTLWSLADQAPENTAADLALQPPASAAQDHDTPRVEAVLSQVRAMIDLGTWDALRDQQVGGAEAVIAEMLIARITSA